MEAEKSNDSIAESHTAAAPAPGGINKHRGMKRVASSIAGHRRNKEWKRAKVEDSAEKLVNWTLERQYQVRREPSLSSGGDDSEDLPIGLGKRDGGHLIMTCNANGMPEDHNERTAYFIIGPGIEHGHELNCSHLVCQKEGLKFKYCSFCQAPVPKLNFSTRHDHSSQQQGKSEGSDDSQGGTRNSRDQADIPHQVTTKLWATSESGVLDESASNSSGKPNKDTAKKVSESSSTNLNASSETQTSGSFETYSMRPSGNSSTSSALSSRGFAEEAARAASLSQPQHAAEASASVLGGANLNRGLEALDTTRRLEWARLLGNRPAGTENRDDLSQWLLDVLSVSDLNAPLKVNDSGSSGTSDDANDSSSDTRETNNSSMDNSALTDQSGTAGSSRTDGSSANDSSSDTRETNNQSTTDSNDSANDSASDTQEPANSIIE